MNEGMNLSNFITNCLVLRHSCNAAVLSI